MSGITQDWRCWCSRFVGLGSWLVVGGVLIASVPERVFAQITPDGTLPNNSIVTPDGSTLNITGGTQAGGNLFHSFSEFSVHAGETASFNNAAEIQNIISRVTGGSISNIDGIIKANGTANLFLINPNGIIFGQNAQLNIGGSFVATTASSIGFGERGFFSATNPNTPELLTVNPSAFFFNQMAAARIQNNSRALAGLAPSKTFTPRGLRVPDNQSLLLVGGDISLDGGGLNAFSGRVELGGLATPGTVGLQVDSNNLSLDFPAESIRAKVSLTNGGNVSVGAAGGGSIAVKADNIEILGSSLHAGIGEGLGSIDAVAGDITLDATGGIKVVGSNVFNNVRSRAVGNGGDINITTGSLSVTNGARLNIGISGQGNAGSISINARDLVLLNGVASNGLPSSALTNVEQGAIGNAGNINITTGSLSVTNGALLESRVRGQRGDAGNIIITANDTVSFQGLSSANSTVETGAIGKGGNIAISTRSFSLTDDAFLQTSTSGQGNAGNVNVRAIDSVSLKDARIFSNVGSGAIGNGGNITITSGSLSLTDDAFLVTSTSGQGNAGSVKVRAIDSVSLKDALIYSNVESGAIGNGGDININAATLSLTDGAQLQTLVRGASNNVATGRGAAGNVNIDVTGALTIAGASGVFSSLETGAIGKGGNITISTRSLSLTDNAFLQTSTNGQGNAGSVKVRAIDSVSLNHASIFSLVESGAVGKGGDININAATLSLTNGAQLNASTDGKGDGGSVIIDAHKSVYFDGVRDGMFPSAAFGNVAGGGEGKGGGIYITTDELSLTNGAQLQASTEGIGDSGNVIINASKSVSFDGVIVGESYTFNSYAASRVYDNAQGKGGNIHITTGEFSLTNGAQVFADTSGKGDAGNIQINATNSVSVSGTSLISGSSSALFTFTNSTDKGGNIIVDTSAFRTLDGGVLNAQTFNDGDGGSITVRAKLVEVLNGGQLLATSSGNGRAGKITVNATDQVIVNGSDATYLDRVEKFGVKVANAFGTNGVNNVNANSGLFVRSESLGSAGDIEVISPQIRLDSSGRFIAESVSGNGGNITLRVRDLLLLRRGSFISTSAGTAQQGGNGGNITITTPNGFIIAVPNENSDITANAYTGKGGRVQINASGIYGTQFREEENPLTSDITASSDFGTSGTVELNTPEIDLNSGLVELPSVPVDTEVTQGCRSPGYAQSSFVINRRGGLPPNPKDVLTPEAPQIDWVSIKPSNNNRSLAPITSKLTASTPKRIVEATGATLNAKGQIVLSANSSTVSSHTSRQNPVQCHGS